MIINGVTLKSSNSFQTSMIITISLCDLMQLGSGFFIPVYAMPKIIQNLNLPNFFRLHFESILLVLYKDRCEATPILFNAFGINESQMITNLYVLIIEGIILRILGLFVTIFRSNSY